MSGVQVSLPEPTHDGSGRIVGRVFGPALFLSPTAPADGLPALPRTRTTPQERLVSVNQTLQIAILGSEDDHSFAFWNPCQFHARVLRYGSRSCCSRLLSTQMHKYGRIRLTLHPGPLCCSSVKYSMDIRPPRAARDRPAPKALGAGLDTLPYLCT